MEKPIMNYETLIRLTKAIPKLRDPEEVILITVEGVTHALNVKGCTLFLFSPMSDELKLAGSYGLSQEYLDKGPISSIHSIASSVKEGKPVAIFDISDDPRIQYPESAMKENISSILSVPMVIGNCDIHSLCLIIIFCLFYVFYKREVNSGKISAFYICTL